MQTSKDTVSSRLPQIMLKQAHGNVCSWP